MKSFRDNDYDGEVWSGLFEQQHRGTGLKKRRVIVGVGALILGVVYMYALGGISCGRLGEGDIWSWRGEDMRRYGESETRLQIEGFHWDQISATEDLQFHPCYDGYECAKLKLPLDYFKGTFPNHSISLAVIKLPARVPTNDPRYGGPILINPGGPGGSGIGQALRTGRFIQTVVDSAKHIAKLDSTAKYFDIIGFDPRGVNNTEPTSDCVADSASRWSWRLREESEGHLDSSNAALGRLWAMADAYGTVCKQSMDSDADIKRYMTTASVARDMLEVVERHAAYVARRRGKECSIDMYKKEAKLQYLGFSYGTYLGATFATIYPDRVGRLVLDGVVNSDDYNYSLGNGSLLDNERAMTSFYTYCALSGPDRCQLAAPNSSIQAISTRAQTVLQSLYHRPLPVHSDNGPEIITYSDLRNLIFLSLYAPVLRFPALAQILLALEHGKGTILEDWASTFHPKHVYACPINNLIHESIDTESAILCSDGEHETHSTITDFKQHWQLLNSISPTSGSIWAILRLRCSHWHIRPVHRFTGTFGANISSPILFLSNTADPVTPLTSARIMQGRFPGSGLLVQDSAGHCALSAASPCVVRAVREYFQHGELPEPGILCVPPLSPFSLNSTDPKSPFYEPELGGSVKVHVSENDIDLKSIRATVGLQEWFASEGRFWPTGGSQRARGLLGSRVSADDSRQA